MASHLQAGPPGLLWSINARAVLETIDRHGPLARPEITRATKLSKTTVAQTLNELTERGVVRVTGLDETRRGPAATLYDLNAGCAHGVAVDIGHHRTRVAIVDVRGNQLARAEAPSAQGREAATVAAVTKLIDECRAQASVTRLDHAVIGVPAVVSPRDGELRLVSGIPEDGKRLPELLASALPMPSTLENDTNLAAVAEYHDGEGAGTAAFVLVSVGAAVGAGIVVDGRLYRGFTGGAGEVAYLPMPEDAPAEVLGARAIATDAEAAGIPGNPSAKKIFELARTGDERALRVVDDTARRISRVIASISFILDPELFVLGGAVGSNGDLLLDPVREHLSRSAPLARVTVAASAVGEDAVLRGAAIEVWQHLREMAFTQATRAGQE
ncbi:ROK family transcriptional regulator [Amycolatopsis alkalitolerans]|uniref:ROK family transcriptional regulator n=1 Tax=Amycolatopsis alkalitolerans TaxID=2547244 RepID=A0A5C4LQY6_9PSEU|nr:ROK family transcriptional regulator [Amycolatopsis alkalitolerans]TNC21007.1 ROK family transcriptional regulator [Amycolatopsis alkalitolerans]